MMSAAEQARADATVLVLAKAPVPGRVKTRLCPPCSPEQAATLAEAAIVDTLAAAVATPGVRPVLVLDGVPGAWVPNGIEIVPQVEGELGTRLAGAFAAVDGPAVLVGMDTPQVTPAVLRGAVEALLRPGTDAVLGHTVDGGWWIIGFRSPQPSAFIDVPMSTAETGALQAKQLGDLGLSVVTLATETDVDTFTAARAVALRAPATAFGRAFATTERELVATPTRTGAQA
ncbi:MAG: TIGR04282 family arsenosugar biosynthesis glycosyltransferase [Acidimicrobiia bacterium]